MNRPTLLIATLLVSGLVTRGALAADPMLTTYNFWCSPGSPSATAWYDDKVCVMIEGETPGDRDQARMDLIVQFFNDLYTEFESVTGLTGLPQSGPWNGRTVIQIPLDNCGAGGLANHGSLGVSVGVGLFESQYSLVLQDKFLQVWFYEINRNFWKPDFNDSFDWAMDDNPVNWGWWTVGMNNAQAYMMTDILGVRLEYFGSGAGYWYDRMVGELDDYIADPQYDFDFGWRQSLMPWHPTESINDMMSGLIMYAYETWGGRTWLEGFYEWIQSPLITDRSGVFAYQECRDNVYRVWSMAAGQDLDSYFSDTLRWVLTDEARDWVSAQLDGTWDDLGGGSPGAAGTPSLTGSGSLTAGSTVGLDLTDAPAGSLLLAWIAFDSTPFPAAGGVVHTLPFANQLLFGADASGTFGASTTWPAGIPPGSEIWFQFVVEDPSVVWGFTLSNGVKATTP